MDNAATNSAESGAAVQDERAAPSGRVVQSDGAEQASSDSDGLLNRLGLIESQPLDQRALGFEQLHDELLTELQRSDHDGV